MKPNAALVSQLGYVYRSGGLRGLARLGIGKIAFPLIRYQRFVVLKAPLRPQIDAPANDALVIGDALHLPGVRDADWPEAAHVLRRYREQGASRDLQLLVARSGERLAGVCLYEFDVLGMPGFKLRAPSRSYFIHQIAVSPLLRGRGIMGRLLDHADRHAITRGAQWRLCLVAPWNRSSLSGFRKSGAVPSGSVRIMRIFGIPLYSFPDWLRTGG